MSHLEQQHQFCARLLGTVTTSIITETEIISGIEEISRIAEVTKMCDALWLRVGKVWPVLPLCGPLANRLERADLSENDKREILSSVSTLSWENLQVQPANELPRTLSFPLDICQSSICFSRNCNPLHPRYIRQFFFSLQRSASSHKVLPAF